MFAKCLCNFKIQHTPASIKVVGFTLFALQSTELFYFLPCVSFVKFYIFVLYRLFCLSLCVRSFVRSFVCSYTNIVYSFDSLLFTRSPQLILSVRIICSVCATHNLISRYSTWSAKSFSSYVLQFILFYFFFFLFILLVCVSLCIIALMVILVSVWSVAVLNA